MILEDLKQQVNTRLNQFRMLLNSKSPMTAAIEQYGQLKDIPTQLISSIFNEEVELVLNGRIAENSESDFEKGIK